ncbi:hypothetical protein CLV30_12929 [Haloactinopolyspora alba]|uniref:Beta-propeller repeat-containing protein n=1 Tax=Haloactinopolyspora alba TaxID=648780 RepID=A0A2P8DEA2_9ACTN|nr:hypothetical protein [Haloactinopolyspora alba]PSK95560.1 hypothetical protein CLV30_12929 [Haloactinopolyspora alba]
MRPNAIPLTGVIALVFAAGVAPVGGQTVTAEASESSLAFSTFLGGRDFDHAVDIAVDASGHVYVLSYSTSKNFPTTSGAFDKKLTGKSGLRDLAVSKFEPNGQDLVWSTYLGGSDSDCFVGCALEMDATGAVYVAGTTESSDFPTTPGAFDTTFNGPSGLGGDAFVTKLAPDGGSLVYSTFIGGAAGDSVFGLEVDSDGAAYVTGTTHRAEDTEQDFPTTAGAFARDVRGYSDAFVTKLAPDGSALDYSTLLGGTDEGTDGETGFAVRVDDSGAAYVTGNATSPDFPTTEGAFDRSPGGSTDGFVTKLAPDGSSLTYSTFLSGSLVDNMRDLGVDDNGAAHVIGRTRSGDFPTTEGSFDRSLGGNSDGFVTKLAPDGSSLTYSTFLGGSSGDGALGIAIDATGRAVVTGSTGSPDYPLTSEAFDATLDGRNDAFVTLLDSSASTLESSTFLGGAADLDRVNAVALDAEGAAHVVGATGSADFPTTPRTFDSKFNGAIDGFVTKLLFGVAE